jgi:hypothetical protein
MGRIGPERKGSGGGGRSHVGLAAPLLLEELRHLIGGPDAR